MFDDLPIKIEQPYGLDGRYVVFIKTLVVTSNGTTIDMALPELHQGPAAPKSYSDGFDDGWNAREAI